MLATKNGNLICAPTVQSNSALNVCCWSRGFFFGDFMIVKVQWPIQTNAEVPLVLIYNKNKSFMKQVPANKEIQERMDGSFKAYFQAQIDHKENVTLGKRITDRNW